MVKIKQKKIDGRNYSVPVYQRECLKCGTVFETLRENGKFCQMQCAADWSNDVRVKKNQLNWHIRNGKKKPEIKRLLNVNEKTYIQLFTSIRKHEDDTRYAVKYIWTSHEQYDELDVMGRFGLRRDYILPCPPQNLTGQTVGECVVKKDMRKGYYICDVSI